ncbi:MATE family multidrug exporter [Insulibacter thermoxylanivorax]|uniref:Probable multidrug resistance protein NorM n=1 Tax=Insulibacter thermoxylanivorax TaxID=2749268 RepID=A0A916VH73_9BACL|nr:MATE family efflux transporter [Insulibacter thermoxylanivorax]GFR39469.1 MATE family multidrug exporter [Insulibacter thermoxylanivorax]
MRNVMSAVRTNAMRLLDRSLSGNTFDYKQIIAIIMPILADQAFIILMSMFNTAMISSSGVAAVSAVSMVDSLNIFIVNVFIAVATGGTVIVAQYKGSGNDKMISRAASQALSLVTIVSLLMCVLVIVFHNPTLHLLFGRAEAVVLDNARIYLIGSGITYPLFAVYSAITGVLRGIAETRVCLFLSVIMNFAYFILNLLFIVGLDMGIVGMVISLFLARVIGMLTSLIYLLRYCQKIKVRLRDAFDLDFQVIKKIMYIGVPFAAEQLFFNGGKLLTQTYIVQFGTLAITANAIGGSLSSLSQIGGSALSIALVTVVGQCMGRGDVPDARRYVRSFLWMSALVYIFALVVILPLFPYIISLFSPPGEIVPVIYELTVLVLLAQPVFWTFSFMLPSALRAAGDSRFTSITAMLTMWLIRVILGYVVGVTFGFGLMGVWTAMVIEWGVRGLIFYLRFRGDKWYRHKLV